MLLTEPDRELLAAARAAIAANYDAVRQSHTVGAAVRGQSGKIYVGVNVYSLHGACAEQVAIGTGITQGERLFTEIVAVRGPQGEQILPPCGNCRQMLCDYMPNCQVLLPDGNGGVQKQPAAALLPFAYAVE